jgi:K+-transporting ATPase KdpF subunit
MKPKRELEKKDTSCWTSFSSQRLGSFSPLEFSTFAAATVEVRSELMHGGDAALLVICALLFGYLLYALLKAEEF